jgi:hypothetical protein
LSSETKGATRRRLKTCGGSDVIAVPESMIVPPVPASAFSANAESGTLALQGRTGKRVGSQDAKETAGDRQQEISLIASLT